MARQIFVNLAIADIARSQGFYRALGFDFNPQFTNEQGACMVVDENIFVMLLVQPFFQSFLREGRAIADPRKATEVLIALSCGSRAQVDEKVRKAEAAGELRARDPEDHAF